LHDSGCNNVTEYRHECTKKGRKHSLQIQELQVFLDVNRRFTAVFTLSLDLIENERM
jgi:hypothetical protein